jgi:putative glycerol-1-phosphate prenyltransferase
MVALYEQILAARRRGHKLLALLIDPDKPDPFRAFPYVNGQVDYIFVGGSTGTISPDFIGQIRSLTSLPVVLFPGSAAQYSPDADALLFLTPMNARDPRWLIDQQVAVAPRIDEAHIHVAPTAYLLIDGGRVSTAQRVMQADPLPRTQLGRIRAYAKAARLMGKTLLYLEAGSGAAIPVPPEVIRAAGEAFGAACIVGGGIRTPEAMMQAFQAGADLVVIGNHFEEDPASLTLFTHP